MTVSSISSPAFISSYLTHTCSIVLVEHMFSGVGLEVVWIGPTNILTADTITSNTGISNTNILTLINQTASDDGTYICNVSLSSSMPFVIGSPTTSNSIIITTGIIYRYTCSICSCIHTYIFMTLYIYIAINFFFLIRPVSNY